MNSPYSNTLYTHDHGTLPRRSLVPPQSGPAACIMRLRCRPLLEAIPPFEVDEMAYIPSQYSKPRLLAVLLLLGKLLMDGSDLLLDVDALKVVNVPLALALRVAVEAVDGRLLPASLFLF